jgi:polysaccharide export outer membrane protein
MSRNDQQSRRNISRRLCSLMLGASLLGAQTSTQDTPATRSAPAAEAAEVKRVIGPDDAVTIDALNVEEISKTWRVSAAGDISLPMIGRVHAAGLTVDQVEDEIDSRLDQFVRKPQVTVYISEFRGHPATVSGAVERPGIVQLQGTTTLFEVLVQAGGPKEPGTTVTLTRSRDNGIINYPGAKISGDSAYSVVELPLKEVLQRDTPAANLPIQAYDVVTVSKDEKLKRLVFVAGEVNRPGAIELVTQNKVSFSQAVAMAGGFTKEAAPGRTIVRHVDPNGAEIGAMQVNGKKILAGNEKDVPLKDGDIVIVPANRLAPYLQTMTSTAITSSVYILGRF